MNGVVLLLSIIALSVLAGVWIGVHTIARRELGDWADFEEELRRRGLLGDDRG